MARMTARKLPKDTFVRVGGAGAIAEALRDLGVDVDETLRGAGIDPGLLEDPDNLISSRARGHLMGRVVAITGCQHFGLLVGQRMNLSSLGLVGLLVRNAPDSGTALQRLVRSLRFHSQATAMEIIVADDLAVLTYRSLQPFVEAADEVADGALAMMLNVMRTLCGPRFKPAEVRFMRPKPADVGPYRRLFRAPLRFDAARNAMVFSRDWLSVQRPDSDPQLERLVQKEIQALENELGDELPAKVRHVLRSALLTDHASAEQVAALFAVHPRTLRRRLNHCRTSFQELVDEVRFEIARDLLERSPRPVSQIAGMLGYARASAFTRAFRRWSGATPVEWRANALNSTDDLSAP